MPGSRRRWLLALRSLAGVTLLLTLATLRVVFSGEAEIAAGTRALRDGQPREAIACSARAAAWYAPGAPHVAVAYRRLARLAEAAEARHRTELALMAWRGVRTPFHRASNRWRRAAARGSTSACCAGG
jgi:hypothetical protein